MKDFYETLSYINETVYSLIGLNIKNVQEEKHNSKYGARSFETPLIITQEWQLPYFVYMNESKRYEIIKLFS